MSLLESLATRWTGRLGVTAFVLAALALGRMIGADLPQPDDVLREPHTHAAQVGEEVQLRRATVTVTDVRLAHGLDEGFGGEPLRTPGIYLVADLVTTATDANATVSQVLARNGGITWRPVRAGTNTCRMAPPGVPQSCQVALEVPVDRLEGMTLMLSAAPMDIRFDDALVITPGFTSADAEQAVATVALAPAVLGSAALAALEEVDGHG